MRVVVLGLLRHATLERPLDPPLQVLADCQPGRVEVEPLLAVAPELPQLPYDLAFRATVDAALPLPRRHRLRRLAALIPPVSSEANGSLALGPTLPLLLRHRSTLLSRAHRTRFRASSLSGSWALPR